MEKLAEDWDKKAINFGIRGTDLNLSSITEELVLTPSKAFNEGEALPGTLSMHKRPWTAWSWSTEGKLISASMEEHAEFLLSNLEPKKQKLEKYLNNPIYEVVIWIDWQGNYLEGGYSLSTRTIQKLAGLCKRIDFAFLIHQ